MPSLPVRDIPKSSTTSSSFSAPTSFLIALGAIASLVIVVGLIGYGTYKLARFYSPKSKEEDLEARAGRPQVDVSIPTFSAASLKTLADPCIPHVSSFAPKPDVNQAPSIYVTSPVIDLNDVPVMKSIQFDSPIIGKTCRAGPFLATSAKVDTKEVSILRSTRFGSMLVERTCRAGSFFDHLEPEVEEDDDVVDDNFEAALDLIDDTIGDILEQFALVVPPEQNHTLELDEHDLAVLADPSSYRNPRAAPIPPDSPVSIYPEAESITTAATMVEDDATATKADDDATSTRADDEATATRVEDDAVATKAEDDITATKVNDVARVLPADKVSSCVGDVTVTKEDDADSVHLAYKVESCMGDSIEPESPRLSTTSTAVIGAEGQTKEGGRAHGSSPGPSRPSSLTRCKYQDSVHTKEPQTNSPRKPFLLRTPARPPRADRPSSLSRMSKKPESPNNKPSVSREKNSKEVSREQSRCPRSESRANASVTSRTPPSTSSSRRRFQIIDGNTNMDSIRKAINGGNEDASGAKSEGAMPKLRGQDRSELRPAKRRSVAANNRRTGVLGIGKENILIRN